MKSEAEIEKIKKRIRSWYIFECKNYNPTVSQIINKTIEEMNK